MRVLVTGAGGYVGYAVGLRLVEAGHDVIGLVRRPDQSLPDGVRPVVADLMDPVSLRAAIDGPLDGVCHLAALTRVRESFQQPLRFFATNVQGTVNLLEGLPDGVRLVCGSTAAVYGTPERQPIPESQLPGPSNPYGASKLAAEQVVRFHARTGAIGAAILRTFNVSGSVDGYGDPDPTRLIPRTLDVAAGRAPRLEVNGDGSAIREYLHVADLADAYLAALTAISPGDERLYNVGSGTGASVSEVVSTVEKVTGRPVPLLRRPPAPEPAALVSDCSAVRRDLAWRPARSTLSRIIADAWAALQ